jgi:hypothetical protein
MSDWSGHVPSGADQIAGAVATGLRDLLAGAMGVAGRRLRLRDPKATDGPSDPSDPTEMFLAKVLRVPR